VSDSDEHMKERAIISRTTRTKENDIARATCARENDSAKRTHTIENDNSAKRTHTKENYNIAILRTITAREQRVRERTKISRDLQLTRERERNEDIVRLTTSARKTQGMGAQGEACK